ncbi:MAG: sensor histidine kinase, partial [Desulfosudaceae bacterium]
NILNYAKSRELQYEEVAVADLAASAVATVRNLADEAGIAIKTDIDPSLVTVEIDASWMQTALINFLENAVDACVLDPKKTGHQIKLSARANNEREFTLAITDNGIGMDQPTRDALFSLFFSSKGASGTGLGLFIANHVVKQHGGFIEVTSRPDRGTCFEICLPRARPEQPRINTVSRAYGNLTF